MENANKVDLKKIFDDYDSELISDSEIAKITDSKTKQEVLESNKIINLKKLFNTAASFIKDDAQNIFSEFNVDFKMTADVQFGQPILNAINFGFDKTDGKENIEVYMNFNIQKLLNLPALEAFSVIYTEMYTTLLKKRESQGVNVDEFKFGKKSEIDKKKDKSQNSIFVYLKKILSLLLGIDQEEQGVDFSSQEYYSGASEKLVGILTSNGISQEEIFSNPNGQNLFAERYGKIVKQGHHKQATHLLGVMSKEEVDVLKTNNPKAIEDFCKKFVVNLLAFNGITENYNIVFKESGALGNYVDKGQAGHLVEINIKKIMNMGNPVEVVSTLTHELTHLIDSESNKRNGFTTVKGQFGLVDNLVGSTKGKEIQRVELIEKNEKVKDFVRDLEKICYRVNPNERSAREGELIALEFMQEMYAGKDQEMEDCIKKSKASFVSYQEDVLKAFKDMESLKSRYDQIEKDICDDFTRRLIDSRLKYLENLKLKGKLNSKSTQNAIDNALGANYPVSAVDPKNIEGEKGLY